MLNKKIKNKPQNPVFTKKSHVWFYVTFYSSRSFVRYSVTPSCRYIICSVAKGVGGMGEVRSIFTPPPPPRAFSSLFHFQRSICISPSHVGTLLPPLRRTFPPPPRVEWYFERKPRRLKMEEPLNFSFFCYLWYKFLTCFSKESRKTTFSRSFL